MCGIYVSISHHGYRPATAQIRARLQQRGPDAFSEHYFTVPLTHAPAPGSKLYISVASSVLALRGTEIVPQPIFLDGGKSLLCWNGEAYHVLGEEVIGNDAVHVFGVLEYAARTLQSNSAQFQFIKAFETLRGPFATAFYDSHHERLYFGRDCLGRRSLEQTQYPNGDLVICSISNPTYTQAWEEVAANGIYYIDLQERAATDATFEIHRMPYIFDENRAAGESSSEVSPFPKINRVSPLGIQKSLSQDTAAVGMLHNLLLTSLRLRVCNVRPRDRGTPPSSTEPNVAVLFSGGLDCTILARLSHELLPPDEPIDLLNVAFENPRIHTDTTINPYEICPDRITAGRSHQELLQSCPGRSFRLVTMDVPYSETLAHRATITELMYPHDTEMDLSIATALYFASRGIGSVSCLDTHGPGPPHSDPPKSFQPYITPARVLLSGLGADELFGGYQRHAIAFQHRGYTGLLDELQLDFDRLGRRNLGRDDRVISHWGKEARYPYLDEYFISWALSAPVWEKCGFGVARNMDEGADLEDGKLVLRLLAQKLGLRGVAREKKRAIQFGSRTAKMESGRVKGTTRLEVNGT